MEERGLGADVVLKRGEKSDDGGEGAAGEKREDDRQAKNKAQAG